MNEGRNQKAFVSICDDTSWAKIEHLGLKILQFTLFEFLTPGLQTPESCCNTRVFYIEYDQLFAGNYIILKYISVFCVKADSWGKFGQVCRIFL